MIDKVELRVPKQAPFTREFDRLYREVRGDPKHGFRSSRHYLAVGDLRPFGYEAILHTYCLHGEGNHKLELIDTSAMTYAQLGSEIERIFDVPATRLELMRIDLAVDVADVPVAWFVDHCRAQYKRWTCDIGKIEYARMGKGLVETFYLGKRPNCFRIYNKIAEWGYQYRQWQRKSEVELAPFEELFGLPETATLTRVERQIAAGRIPDGIGTFGKLRSLPSFNPFAYLEFLSGQPEPQLADYDLSTYLQGMGLRSLIDQHGGIQRARKLLNQHSPGNASRILKKFRDFLPHHPEGLTEEQLFASYQESITLQLAA